MQLRMINLNESINKKGLEAVFVNAISISFYTSMLNLEKNWIKPG